MQSEVPKAPQNKLQTLLHSETMNTLSQNRTLGFPTGQAGIYAGTWGRCIYPYQFLNTKSYQLNSTTLVILSQAKLKSARSGLPQTQFVLSRAKLLSTSSGENVLYDGHGNWGLAAGMHSTGTPAARPTLLAPAASD